MPSRSPGHVHGKATDIAEIDEVTVRVHWTDQPYVWHVNDGPEVFVVVDGIVDMHYRNPTGERVERLPRAGSALPR